MSLRLRLPAAVAAVALAATLTACGSSDDDSSAATTEDSAVDVSLTPLTQPSIPEVSIPAELPTELVTTVITEGTGEPAVAGDTVAVQYVGVRSEDGTQFDTNFGGEPFVVTLGAGGVIKGWDEGLVGVKAGERVQLDIPSDLAYGDADQGDVIKAGDALTFLIDVLAVAPAVDPATAVTQADIPTASETSTESTTEDLREGTGATLEAGQSGLFHLVAARRDDGTILESTWDSLTPQPLTMDPERLMAGLAEGLTGMQVGGRRAVVLPYDANFGLTPETDVVVIADLLAVY